MENVTKIYLDKNSNPVISYYNGSWKVIKHESTDGKDYSIMIWETIYDGIYDAEENLGRELNDEEYVEEVAYIIENITDFYDIKIVYTNE